MKYYAKVIALNADVEEEIVLSFGEWELCCFIDDSPVEIIIGNLYLVDLNIFNFAGLRAQRATCGIFAAERVANTFAYAMTGVLMENIFILSGLTFQNDSINSYLHLENEYVTIFPDRITVSFIDGII